MRAEQEQRDPAAVVVAAASWGGRIGDDEESGWLADALHPEGLAGQAQGAHLAARAGWIVLSGHAPLWAQDDPAVHAPAGEVIWARSCGTRRRRGKSFRPLSAVSAGIRALRA